MTEFREVPRPHVLGRTARMSAETAAFLGTPETGNAIVIPLNGRRLHTIHQKFYTAARTRGWRAHVIQNHDGTVTAWCEKPQGETR